MCARACVCVRVFTHACYVPPWELSWACVCVHVCVHVLTRPAVGTQAAVPPRRFFEDLERRHKAQVCVEDISDILEEHAESHFHPYVAYCSNEVYQQRALQKLT